jgi:hypothetical protein
MEPKGSVPRSHGRYPELDKSNSHPTTPFP